MPVEATGRAMGEAGSKESDRAAPEGGAGERAGERLEQLTTPWLEDALRHRAHVQLECIA
jgi:hypothetical protein